MILFLNEILLLMIIGGYYFISGLSRLSGLSGLEFFTGRKTII